MTRAGIGTPNSTVLSATMNQSRVASKRAGGAVPAATRPSLGWFEPMSASSSNRNACTSRHAAPASAGCGGGAAKISAAASNTARTCGAPWLHAASTTSSTTAKKIGIDGDLRYHSSKRSSR
jgi:hypothetical protein